MAAIADEDLPAHAETTAVFARMTPEQKLRLVKGLQSRGHIVAMTGSYFRGDAAPVLMPEDENKFETVSYTYYEQLNGYEHLKSLNIGYFFYSGRYLSAIEAVLDPELPDQRQPIHAGHVLVGQDQIDLTATELVERILTVDGLDHLVA
jgi:hypothetical protein